MVAGAPRVFISQLAGVAVFDPDGDQVGRVRDVVVVLRVGGRPPRVLGLVVEVVSRHRIFLPMTRVIGLESGQVITTGVVNLRRFEQRAAETLVLGELLDRKVWLSGADPAGRPDTEDPEHGETGDAKDTEVTVLDVAMSQLPARRDWEIDKVFVRRGKGGALRRRGETLTVEWSAVSGFRRWSTGRARRVCWPPSSSCAPRTWRTCCTTCRRSAAARSPPRWTTTGSPTCWRSCPRTTRSRSSASSQEERAADVLEAMDPDDAADLLSELPEEEKERLLALMQPQDAAPLRRLLTYEEHTAGGLMTTEPIVLRPDATVAEALARVRNPDLSPALAAQVYVCRPPDETPTGKYLGVVHFQRLLRDPPFTLVGAIVDTDLRPLRAGHPAARGHQLPRHVQHDRRARGGRQRFAAGRGDGGRRAGPPAAGGLAGLRRARRVLTGAANRGGRRWPLTGPSAASSRRPACRPRRAEERGWTSRASRGETCCPPGTRRRSAGCRERIARFLGTGRFIVWMTVVIIAWVIWNVGAPLDLRFDQYPFIFLTLVLSLQASYAAPLILLAQNRQDDRDRVNLEQDRRQNERSIADTEYLTREIAALRMDLGEVATRDWIRSELQDMLQGSGGAQAPGSA